jgi:drug/metabolite transporter (DMT)-like permease
VERTRMNANLRGILAMVASTAGFAVNDAIVKLATTELPTGELIVIRGIMATTLIALAAWYFSALRPISVLLQPAMMLRILAAAVATLFIVAALRYLPLAITSAVLQVTPLLVTAGSALLLGSRVGWQRWTFSLVGLAGVLLIIRPGANGLNAHVWIALAALLFTTMRDLTTRFIDHSVPSLFVALASSAVITLAGAGLAATETWVVPSWRALALLAGASLAVVIGYHLGVVAMRTGEIAAVAPFRYSTILLALMLSYLIWGYVPDEISLLGIVIVCLAGLYLLTRERAAIPTASPISTSVSRPR